jgi:1-phosphofructokinase
MRLVTLTLNPAIDATVALAALRPGAVNAAEGQERHAAGKGINVAACLGDWGAAVTATGLLGAANDGIFRDLFRNKGIDDRCTRIPGETRTNIKLLDRSSGETTDINLPGLVPDDAALGACLGTLEALAEADGIAVLSGSLPRGVPADLYARLTARLAAGGMRVVVDASGAPLRALLEGGVMPDAIKPNRHELEDWAGEALPDLGALLRAARRLAARGVGLVVVSMGGEGALFATAGAALRLRPPPVPVTSSVGAGDAMVAGIVAGMAEGLDLPALACRATAFAAAKLRRSGAQIPGRAAVEAIAATLRPEPIE